MDVEERIAELTAEVRRLNDLYYGTGDSPLPDADYDALKDEPTSVRVLMIQTDLAAKQGDAKSARQYLDTALQSAPTNLAVLLMKANLEVAEGKPDAAKTLLDKALAAAYDGELFVRVLPEGQQPHTSATAGSNAAHLQAVLDVDSGRIVVTCAIDNLGKGAAGQALQNANLMLGLPEAAGLTTDGVAP